MRIWVLEESISFAKLSFFYGYFFIILYFFMEAIAIVETANYSVSIYAPIKIFKYLLSVNKNNLIQFYRFSSSCFFPFFPVHNSLYRSR